MKNYRMNMLHRIIRDNRFIRFNRQNKLGFLILVILAALLPFNLSAGNVETHFQWADGKPRLEILITPEPVAGTAMPSEIIMPLKVFDAKGEQVWETQAKIPSEPQTPWKAVVAIGKITEFKQQYRVELSLRDDTLGLDYLETFFFAKPEDTLWSYGLRRQGAFPAHKVYFTAAIKEYKASEFRDIPVSAGVFDAEENSVLDVTRTITPGPRPTWHAVDITPPEGKKMLGPFRADISIESDVYSIYLNTSLKFPYPNALVPVTGFEHGDVALWFAAAAELPQSRPLVAQPYYTPQFCQPMPATYPEVIYDAAEKHSGRLALRVGYKTGDRVHAWSRQSLPGKPSVLSVWVKGNGTQDQLIVTFEDFINYTIPGWGRNANIDQAHVCTLNFTGWRRFRVPVLGDGMQQTGIKGSSTNIDAPVAITAFSILPGPRQKDEKTGQPTAIWLDDVAVETQAPPAELLTLELQSSNPDGELGTDGILYAAIGNGFAAELAKGRLSLTARNGKGEVIYTATQDMRVGPQQYAVANFALKEIADKKPRGPVDLEVVFADSGAAGARAAQHAVLKSADQGGLCFDFEEPEVYSSFDLYRRNPQDGLNPRVKESTTSIVPGGADGAGNALLIPVKSDTAYNSALLHPALPGQLDHVEFMVKGDGKPNQLQVMFIDSGNTGVTGQQYNIFWTKPITVDWSDWRKVSFKGPPIPAHYNEKNYFFLLKPCFPLNLVINVQRPPDSKDASQIWVDNVRVLTHLPESEELKIDVDYADESRIHPAGAPLRLIVYNFGTASRELKLEWKLRNYQDVEAGKGLLTASIPSGAKQKLELVKSLQPGIYDLTVNGAGPEPLVRPILVLNAQEILGPDPLAVLKDPVKLRQLLGLLTEKAYLDWDNTEPMPNSFHFDWFNKDMEKKNGGGMFRIVPVLGFSSDWAGIESVESIQKETYARNIPNLYQLPARLVDWSRFVRECVREYSNRFDEWIFWENPDIDGAPQYVPPAKYGEMLGCVNRWVKLYSPKSRVTAGGFNFNRVLGYLDAIKDPSKLTFDDISVQMNIGELSPEAVDLEGFLDELDQILHLRETGRRVQTAELDWGIGPFVSPQQQSAYHSRAAMILNSRQAIPHQFSVANGGFEYEGYGTFYRMSYGSTGGLQTLKPVYVPKPSFFAHIAIQKFLKDWQYQGYALPADRSLDNNRIFLYKNGSGLLTAAMWRVFPGERLYRLPATWSQATAVDAFGFPVKLDTGLRLTALPIFVCFPAGATLQQVVFECRHLEAADGSFPMIAEIHLSEEDSALRASYKATGNIKKETHTAVIPGAYKVRETFLTGLESESFTVNASAAGNLLLKRRWYMDGTTGQKLTIAFNGQPPQSWDLGVGQDTAAGIRESSFVLIGAKTGANNVTINYEKPGNCALYRIEPLAKDYVELSRWGVLGTRQTQGDIQEFKSAVGTPLRIAKQDFEDGIGAHAVSFIEYPINGQFKSFEVTVGIDGQTEGRGSVVFRVFVDGKEKANSGTMNGFTVSKTLKVDDLAGARRLLLSVLDAGDGNKNDLADWVNGKLYLK